MRGSVACLLAGLTALAAFALSAQHGVVSEAKRADTATRLATVYQDARFWVGQNESLERKYRVEPSPAVLVAFKEAGVKLVADLRELAAVDGSPPVKAMVVHLLQVHQGYEQATRRMFAAVFSGNIQLIRYLDITVTDPIFTVMQTDVYGGASAASRNALRQSATLRKNESEAFDAGVLAVVVAIGLVGIQGLVVRRYRRAGMRMRAAELKRLSLQAITDPLTALGNHRAFHQDLTNEIQRTARAGVPLSLVLLDVDDLKEVNDSFGHQAGDEQLRALGTAIASVRRASDRAYRIGGDEFAVILPSIGSWGAVQFAQRLQATLERLGARRVHVTAGIAQALELRPKDELINEADRALITAKRSDQAVALYAPDMDPFEQSSVEEKDEHHSRTLAGALALAVDAKDPYTQSHCQTVSNLCAAIATELGFDAERLRHVRLAGLLHDVGKVGIPDAILQKPTKLSAPEYEQMKTHTVLGEGIILAADMPLEARWVRHHHERIDGCGYPDGLTDRAIPLESRIIHVADAFEAMISDRPYRKAPGERFAIEELRRHAGTQFDQDVVDALLRALGDSPASEPLTPHAPIAARDSRALVHA
jgi:diguanylate cyclase (GGDEF)-like protein/putative nucleotidyltransferase with HDIG domain